MKLRFLSKIKNIVDISEIILFLGFFFIDNPVFIIDNILIEILSSLKMECDEPLVCEIVKVHWVSYFPVVHSST